MHNNTKNVFLKSNRYSTISLFLSKNAQNDKDLDLNEFENEIKEKKYLISEISKKIIFKIDEALSSGTRGLIKLDSDFIDDLLTLGNEIDSFFDELIPKISESIVQKTNEVYSEIESRLIEDNSDLDTLYDESSILNIILNSKKGNSSAKELSELKQVLLGFQNESYSENNESNSNEASVIDGLRSGNIDIISNILSRYGINIKEFIDFLVRNNLTTGKIGKDGLLPPVSLVQGGSSFIDLIAKTYSPQKISFEGENSSNEFSNKNVNNSSEDSLDYLNLKKFESINKKRKEYNKKVESSGGIPILDIEGSDSYIGYYERNKKDILPSIFSKLKDDIIYELFSSKNISGYLTFDSFDTSELKNKSQDYLNLKSKISDIYKRITGEKVEMGVLKQFSSDIQNVPLLYDALKTCILHQNEKKVKSQEITKTISEIQKYLASDGWLRVIYPFYDFLKNYESILSSMKGSKGGERKGLSGFNTSSTNYDYILLNLKSLYIDLVHSESKDQTKKIMSKMTEFCSTAYNEIENEVSADERVLSGTEMILKLKRDYDLMRIITQSPKSILIKPNV